jgi:hypothetical protein
VLRFLPAGASAECWWCVWWCTFSLYSRNSASLYSSLTSLNTPAAAALLSLLLYLFPVPRLDHFLSHPTHFSLHPDSNIYFSFSHSLFCRGGCSTRRRSYASLLIVQYLASHSLERIAFREIRDIDCSPFITAFVPPTHPKAFLRAATTPHPPYKERIFDLHNSHDSHIHSTCL